MNPEVLKLDRSRFALSRTGGCLDKCQILGVTVEYKIPLPPDRVNVHKKLVRKLKRLSEAPSARRRF